MREGLTVGLIEASMGPRFFKRGEYAIQNLQVELARMLQWGHAFSSVESSREAPPHQHPATKLQWGHAFSSVERSARRMATHTAAEASMGPRFFKRGEVI